jgi:Probable cobalt transporter subunit (CbtB)
LTGIATQPRLESAGYQAAELIIEICRQDMRGFIQAQATPPVPIPIGEILPWLAFAGIIGLLLIYFVGAEEGATALISGSYVHEFVHDGRHLLAFPCH